MPGPGTSTVEERGGAGRIPRVNAGAELSVGLRGGGGGTEGVQGGDQEVDKPWAEISAEMDTTSIFEMQSGRMEGGTEPTAPT